MASFKKAMAELSEGPLLAIAGALAPLVTLALEKLPRETREDVLARLQALRDQLPPQGWSR